MELGLSLFLLQINQIAIVAKITRNICRRVEEIDMEVNYG